MSGNRLLNRVVLAVALVLIAGLAWGLIDSRSETSRLRADLTELRADNDKLKQSNRKLEMDLSAATMFAKDSEAEAMQMQADMQKEVEEAKKQ